MSRVRVRLSRSSAEPSKNFLKHPSTERITPLSFCIASAYMPMLSQMRLHLTPAKCKQVIRSICMIKYVASVAYRFASAKHIGLFSMLILTAMRLRFPITPFNRQFELRSLFSSTNDKLTNMNASVMHN